MTTARSRMLVVVVSGGSRDGGVDGAWMKKKLTLEHLT